MAKLTCHSQLDWESRNRLPMNTQFLDSRFILFALNADASLPAAASMHDGRAGIGSLHLMLSRYRI